MPTPALIVMNIPPTSREHLSSGRVEQHLQDTPSLPTIRQTGSRLKQLANRSYGILISATGAIAARAEHDSAIVGHRIAFGMPAGGGGGVCYLRRKWTDSLSGDGFLLDVTVVVVGTASVKLVVATAPDAPVALTLYVATNQSGRLNESLMCLVLPLITEVLGSHILG